VVFTFFYSDNIEDEENIESKGAASAKGSCGHWQGGKKYAAYEGSRLFLLSQELYDIENLVLTDLKVVIARVASNQFKVYKKDNKTNRTALHYSTLKNSEGIIIECNKVFNKQMYVQT